MRYILTRGHLLCLFLLTLPLAAASHTAIAGEENGNRVSIIDVSNPDSPVVKATVSTSFTGVQAIAIDSQGSRAVAVGKNECGVQIIDITNPSAPVVGPRFCSTFAGISSLAVAGTRAVIGEQFGPGIQVLDISGSTPVQVGSTLNLPFNPVSALGASGTLAVATAGNGSQVAVIDISGSSPLQVSGSPLQSAYAGISSAAASGSRAVIGQRSGPGVRSLTITGSPALGTNLNTGLTGVGSVALASTTAIGARALLAEETSGRVVVVNVTTSTPATVGAPLQTGFSGSSSVAAVVGMGWVGVVGQRFGPGVRVIRDLSTSAPSLGGSVNTPLVGVSSIAMTIAPPDSASGHGDPHLTTVDGTRYDFQGAGEFVYLRSSDMEVQARQTAIATQQAGVLDPYTGLSTCVSLNTAVAARIGNNRVTFQPNLNGNPDPSGLQLRINGELAALGADGINFPDGGRLSRTSVGGIRIDSPSEATLLVTPGWWSSQSKWYLNVDVLHASHAEGVLGPVPEGSWLPNLPDQQPMGPLPASLHQRYLDLYQKFGAAWRVSGTTSLFDYAPGTSTATSTRLDWPPENGPCMLPGESPVEPTSESVARQACSGVRGENTNKDCVFDVRITGNTGFAATYALTETAVAEVFEPKVPTTSAGKFAVLVDLGAVVPSGSFSNGFRTGLSFSAAIEYQYRPDLFAVGSFGYLNLDQRTGGSVDIYYLSGNAKAYLPLGSTNLRPFLNGGIGVYRMHPGSTNMGANIGAGIFYAISPSLGVQGSYNFHTINTSGSATTFSTVQVGVRLAF